MSRDGEDLDKVLDDLDEMDGTRLLPGPGEPMAVARVIAADLHTTDSGDLALRHWRGGWMRWQGSHWVEDEHRAVRAELYEFTEYAEWLKTDGQGNKSVEPWGPTRYKVADLAEALGAVLYLPEGTAQPGWIGWTNVPDGVVVSCANGLLHVASRTLHEHTPRWFNVTSVPFDYDPEATPPTRWLAFLDDLFGDDSDSIALLQEYCGYVLSGRLDLQKILLVVGPTRGGKGVIARLLGKLVGPANVAGPTLNSLGGEFGLAPLLGKPLAVISDARLDGRGHNSVIVERLLSISGEDTLTVNIKYAEQRTGKLPTRLLLLSNELPHFGDASAAITGRFVILQLTESWLGREDLDLELELEAELPAILNWTLDGLERLDERGRFTRPAYHDTIVETLAELASPVGAFIRARCELSPLLSIPAADLYAAYKTWCEDNGHKPVSVQLFGRNLRAVVPTLKRTRPWADSEDRPWWYEGVTLHGRH